MTGTQQTRYWPCRPIYQFAVEVSCTRGEYIHALLTSQQKRYIDPMLVYCWASVANSGPKLKKKHWVNVLCYLGLLSISTLHFILPYKCLQSTLYKEKWLYNNYGFTIYNHLFITKRYTLYIPL